MPSEQPREGTRAEAVQALRDMREDWQWCADDQERMDAIKRGCLRNVAALDEAIAALAPAQPEQPRGEEDDLATRLEDLASWLEPDSPFHGTIREAAQLARASTHPEQSERIVGAALDLLDSLGAPHYHDLIGTTYTLHKEQADKLRTATRTTKGGRDDG
jgi:hypothetical protein